MKGAKLIEAEEYMITFPRSNFPSDLSISIRFNLNRQEVFYMRKDLIKEGKLKFVEGKFIPKDFKEVPITKRKIKTPFVLEKESDGQC